MFSSSLRVISPRVSRLATVRSLCAPAERFRTVLEEYRLEHFSRELPSRFRKEVVKALMTKEDAANIQVDSLNLILNNIGRPDQCLTEAEIDLILQDLGCAAQDRSVPVDKILQLM
ncbi:expressed unknown protein [Seminavis robusta]|uniref:Uncharacterized protein n=1 Tax=Seminavis robusta TaxID=568900 RepID=A0A9N8E5D6_9STRA|nr:expressed unknown protein [Seminavis robusta]|eukprot:Sro636_g179250.1 n/a (116) ;mRNA; r:20742-21089